MHSPREIRSYGVKGNFYYRVTTLTISLFDLQNAFKVTPPGSESHSGSVCTWCLGVNMRTSIEIFLPHHHLRFLPTLPVLNAPFSWIPSFKILSRTFSHDGYHLLTAKISSSMDHCWCRDGVNLSGGELSEASCAAEGFLFRFEGDLYLTKPFRI